MSDIQVVLELVVPLYRLRTSLAPAAIRRLDMGTPLDIDGFRNPYLIRLADYGCKSVEGVMGVYPS